MGAQNSSSGQWCSNNVNGSGSWVLDCSACSVGEELNFGPSTELAPGPAATELGHSSQPPAPRAVPPDDDAQQLPCSLEAGLDGGTGGAAERPNGSAAPNRPAASPSSPGTNASTCQGSSLPRPHSTGSPAWLEVSPSHGIARSGSTDSPRAAQRGPRGAPPEVQRARPAQSPAKVQWHVEPTQPPSPSSPPRGREEAPRPLQFRPPAGREPLPKSVPSAQAGRHAEPKAVARSAHLEGSPLVAPSVPEDTEPVLPPQPVVTERTEPALPPQLAMPLQAPQPVQQAAVPEAVASLESLRPLQPPEALQKAGVLQGLPCRAAASGAREDALAARVLLRWCYASVAATSSTKQELPAVVRTSLAMLYRSVAARSLEKPLPAPEKPMPVAEKLLPVAEKPMPVAEKLLPVAEKPLAEMPLQPRPGKVEELSGPAPGEGGILKRCASKGSPAWVVKKRSVEFHLPEDKQAVDLSQDEPKDEGCVGGTLRIRIFAAHNLTSADGLIFRDSQTPYVIARVGKKEYRTESVPNDSDPTWSSGNEFTFDNLEGEACKEPLYLQVMSANSIRRDHSLGHLSVTFDDLSPAVWNWQRHYLQGGKGGELEFTLRFDPDEAHSDRPALGAADHDWGQAYRRDEAVLAILRNCYAKAS